jgi:hypothetical protein
MGLRSIAGLVFALAACAAAFADTGSPVRGRVVDPDGLPLPGVTVTFVPVARASGPTVVTDVQGRFALTVPAGRYRLRAQLSGFEGVEQEVSVGAGSPAELDITLRLVAYHEQVTVKAEAPRPVLGEPHPDAPVTATREVVDSGMLPNSQYDDVLPLLPNVVRGPDGLISVAGASAPQGGLLVNGFNLGDPLNGEAVKLLPLEAIDSVEVFSGGYAADAGRATGGVTSVHTRSGGDVWHASANSFFPRLRFINGGLHGVDSWEPNVGVNGPLVKGRLFVEEAISYRFDRNRFDTLSGPQDSVYSALMSWTQIDAQVSPSQHLVASWSADPQRTDRANVSAFAPSGAVPRLDRGGWSTGLSDRFTLGESATLEVGVGDVRTHLSVTPDGTAPYVVGHDLIQGSYFDRQELHGERTEATAVLSWTAPAGHLIRAGAEVGRLSIDGTGQAGVVDLLRSDGSPSLTIAFEPVPGLSAAANEVGLFVQDRWSPTSRLTIDAGVRYDRTSSVRSAVSPRGAWTITLPGSATTLSGSVGVFADKIPLEAYAFPLSQPRLVEIRDTTGAPGAARLYTNVIQGPLDTPTALRWDVEVDHHFTSRWQARLKYQERRGRHELVVEPIDLAPDSGLLALESTGTSRARSLEATVAFRAPAAGHELYVSYVRSATLGNVNSLDTIQGAFREPFVQPDQAAPLKADVPNRLLAWGLVRLPSRITVAPFVEVRDGFPYSPVTDDWRYAGPPYGARLPWFGALDLYVNKVFTLSHRLPDARIGLKLYNLASIHTERDVQRDVARPDFGTTYNPIPRDFTMVFELLWGRQ